MKTKRNFAILIMAISALLMSASALASDVGQSAGSLGVDDRNGANCYFAYHIIKYGPDYAFVGDEIRYKVVVTNIGDCDLRHIDVKDVLPDGVKFESAKPTPTWTHHHRLGWENIKLEENHRAVFLIKAKVKDESCNSTITNTACAFTPLVGIQICDSAQTYIYR